MTRRDYVRIAAALREAAERCERIRQTTTDADGNPPQGAPFDNSAFGLQIAREALAQALAADNPRFDAARFFDAAEPQAVQG